MNRYYLSVWVNVHILKGQREMICSRVIREKRRVCIHIIDTLYFWDKKHTLTAYRWERRWKRGNE